MDDTTTNNGGATMPDPTTGGNTGAQDQTGQMPPTEMPHEPEAPVEPTPDMGHTDMPQPENGGMNPNPQGDMGGTQMPAETPTTDQNNNGGMGGGM